MLSAVKSRVQLEIKQQVGALADGHLQIVFSLQRRALFLDSEEKGMVMVRSVRHKDRGAAVRRKAGDVCHDLSGSQRRRHSDGPFSHYGGTAAANVKMIWH